MRANAKKILVVEDEIEIGDMLKDFLEEKNFEVELATDGIRALELIGEDIPGIVIMDLLLPGEHGINLIKTIKSNFFIPIIIISGVYRLEEIQPVMDEYFVEGFLEKPLDLNRLMQLLNKIVDARAL